MPDSITADPHICWGTPFLTRTGTSVADVVALHRAGRSVPEILEVRPELTEGDVFDALGWYASTGEEGIRPRPPEPGDDHPRIEVNPQIQGGFPVVRGTRVTVDAICGRWEDGATLADILADYPSLDADDVLDALAYDDMAARR
jgi:uncharacterized protein (DUF433 family)